MSRGRSTLAAALACASAVLVALAGPARAGTAPGAQAAGGPTVTAAAQAEAAGYWTPARMESATPVNTGDAPGTASPARSAAIPSPVHFAGVPTVGALFFTTGGHSHFCTASVVDSSAGDIALTAAHCVYSGSYAADIVFVPQWHDGHSPHGLWAVARITVPPGWLSSRDPNLDYAFLTIAPQERSGIQLQRVTGGLRLGVNLGFRHKIYVIGYNDTDSEPVGCSTASARFNSAQMKFYCNSYRDGTSGGPWILDFNRVTGSGIVFGNIGGYERGGDFPYLSYSPYYGSAVLRLFQQAQRALRPGQP